MSSAILERVAMKACCPRLCTSITECNSGCLKTAEAVLSAALQPDETLVEAMTRDITGFNKDEFDDPHEVAKDILETQRRAILGDDD